MDGRCNYCKKKYSNLVAIYTINADNKVGIVILCPKCKEERDELRAKMYLAPQYSLEGYGHTQISRKRTINDHGFWMENCNDNVMKAIEGN